MPPHAHGWWHQEPICLFVELVVRDVGVYSYIKDTAIYLLYIICVYIQLRLCMLIIVNQIVGHPKWNRKGLWLLKGLCSHTDLHSIIALFIIQPSQSSMSFKRNIMHGHLCLTNFSQPGPCLSSRHPRNSLCLGSLSIGKMMNLNLLKWNSQRSIKVLQTFWRIVWSGVFRIHMLYSITRRGSWGKIAIGKPHVPVECTMLTPT